MRTHERSNLVPGIIEDDHAGAGYVPFYENNYFFDTKVDTMSTTHRPR